MPPIDDGVGRREAGAKILHDLRERVKELTALHGTARILQNDLREIGELLDEVVALIPPAWQYPEITCARIVFDESEVCSAFFATSPWRQSAEFRTASGKAGRIDVFYTESAPESAEGPFLAEERNLINSLAEMLRSFLERRETQRALQAAHAGLERRVDERTAELVSVNRELQEEIGERKRKEERIGFYRERLRSLAAELSLAEEAERRAIASDLHDHIGQALTTLKMKVLEIQRSMAFSGYEQTLEEMRALLDQTIRTTRSLTVEISPPVLYELGLVPAIQWLGDQFKRKHGLAVEVRAGDVGEQADEVVRITVFKAVREFLVNTVKHARAHGVTVEVTSSGGQLIVRYRDDGVGFDPAVVEGLGTRTDAFGLFNVRERCEYLGGRVGFESHPGGGVDFLLELPLKVQLQRESVHAGAHRHR
ncbi:MAG: sensor histidine kinase [Thermoanaerobaculaceae bacterium]|jgi:signal transduction histidine kinase